MAEPTPRGTSFFERLTHLDRRWLFLAMAIAIVVPLLYPVSLSFRVSPMVRAVYDEIEQLPEGTVVLLSLDYDPASKPELQPFTEAVVRHLLRRGCRPVFVTLWATAVPIIDAIIADIVEGEYKRGQGYFAGHPHPDWTYGRDYLFLGYKDGKEAAIAAMGQNLRQLFSSDRVQRQSLSRLPIMEGINSLRDFRLIVNSSAGSPGAKEYVQQVVSRYHLRFASATTAVSVTDLTPYYPEQMFGLIGGMRGSAEYEQLIQYEGTGIAGLNVLTFGQLLVIAAILLGNFIFVIERRRGRRR